jgi:hypothetical protein
MNRFDLCDIRRGPNPTFSICFFCFLQRSTQIPLKNRTDSAQKAPVFGRYLLQKELKPEQTPHNFRFPKNRALFVEKKMSIRTAKFELGWVWGHRQKIEPITKSVTYFPSSVKVLCCSGVSTQLTKK